MDDAISLNDAAERLGVHYMTVYRYVRTGRLPATKDGVEWRIDPADLERIQSDAPVRRSGRSRNELARRLEARLVAGDENGAWTAVEAALASGVDPAAVYLQLLNPALVSIGARWASGDIDVADEHQASAVASRLIGRLGPQFRRRGRRRGTILLGAPPGERHAIPIAVAADLLRGRNFEVIDLGADTPAASFVHAATSATRLRLVGIGVTVPNARPAAAEVIVALRDAGVTVPIAVGGGAFETARQALELGADLYTDDDGESAVDLLSAAAGGER